MRCNDDNATHYVVGDRYKVYHNGDIPPSSRIHGTATPVQNRVDSKTATPGCLSLNVPAYVLSGFPINRCALTDVLNQ